MASWSWECHNTQRQWMWIGGMNVYEYVVWMFINRWIFTYAFRKHIFCTSCIAHGWKNNKKRKRWEKKTKGFFFVFSRGGARSAAGECDEAETKRKKGVTTIKRAYLINLLSPETQMFPENEAQTITGDPCVAKPATSIIVNNRMHVFHNGAISIPAPS